MEPGEVTAARQRVFEARAELLDALDVLDAATESWKLTGGGGG
jgi:outer membrane protein TolC